MEKIILTQHHKNCKKSLKESPWSDVNNNEFFFQAGGQFYLIVYCDCMVPYHINHLDEKMDVIRMVIENVKIYSLYTAYRERIDTTLKDFRLRGIALKTMVKDINYIYSNNAGKRFAITSKIDYIDRIFNQEEFKKNYEETLSELSVYDNTRDRSYLINELKELYSFNIWWEDNYEIVKTIDHMRTLINKQINKKK